MPSAPRLFGEQSRGNSLHVVDEFFGHALETRGGPVVEDVVALPPEQLRELTLRVLEASRDRYEAAINAEGSRPTYPVGLRESWWQDELAPELSKVKLLACYLPQVFVPDPLWDVAEELASFAIILHGGDPRSGLIGGLDDVDSIAVNYGAGDVFYSGTWVYPATSLESRVSRMEAYGNDARPLLTTALRRLVELRPLLDSGALDLVPYPDARMGLHRVFRTELAQAAQLHAEICSSPETCAARAPWLSGAFGWDAAAEAHIDAIGHHLAEHGGGSAGEAVSHLMHVSESLVAVDWKSKALLDAYAKLRGVPRMRDALHADALALVEIPGVRGIPLRDVASLVADDEALVGFRGALGRVLSGVRLDDPDTAQSDFEQAAAEQLHEAAARLRDPGRTLPARAAEATGTVGLTVAAMRWLSAGSLPLDALVTAAGAQIPWAAQVAERRRKARANAPLRRILMSLLERE